MEKTDKKKQATIESQSSSSRSSRKEQLSLKEKKKRRELALRFGNTMIKKKFLPRKSLNFDRMKKLGIVCEDDIVVGRLHNHSSSQKRKKKTGVDMSLFDDGTEEQIDEYSSLFSGEPLDYEVIPKKKRKFEDVIESKHVKIPKTAKYFTSLEIETYESNLIGFEFIEIIQNNNSKNKVMEIKELVDSSLNYDESEEDFLVHLYGFLSLFGKRI